MTAKYSHLVLFLLTTSYTTAASVDLKCEFKYHNYTTIGKHYTCFVKNDLTIIDSNILIENVLGIHEDKQSLDSVTALSIDNAKIHFIPSNLDEKFPNLTALTISNGKLKELHQADLKPLIKLMYLNLDGNQIEVLEDGLFEFNSELKLIWFYNNKIKIIGSSVFSILKNLVNLDLSNNVCISKKFANYRIESNAKIPFVVSVVLIPSMLSKINEKCSVESNLIIETTTILSKEQIYQEKINKLESRLLEVMLINSKNQEELNKAQKQQNPRIHTESSREYEANRKIFKLETDLKVEKAKVLRLEEKSKQKDLELRNMSDDLRKAHESIKRFEEEIARNYATLRSADRAEISQLEDEKAELNKKIGEILNLMKELKGESEAEIQKAKEEIEELKFLLFKDETQEIEIVEIKLDESPNANNTIEIEIAANELNVNMPASSHDTAEVETSSTKLDTSTEGTSDVFEKSSKLTDTEFYESTKFDSTAGVTSDYAEENSELSTLESTDFNTTTIKSSDYESDSSEASTIKSHQETETEENAEASTIEEVTEISTETNEDESYSETDYLFSTSFERVEQIP